MADVNPVGPIYAAGDEIITKSGYIVAYLRTSTTTSSSGPGNRPSTTGCLTPSVSRGKTGTRATTGSGSSTSPACAVRTRTWAWRATRR